MRIVILILVVLVVSSCSLLKNTSRTQNDRTLKASHKSSTSINEQKDWIKKAQSSMFFHDSTQLDYAIQLWPKGTFTYSPQNGFQGEAGKVLIYGKSTAAKSSIAHYNTVEKDQGKSLIKTYEIGEVKTKDTNRKTNQHLSWKTVLAGLLIIAILIWYLVKRIKYIFPTILLL